MLPSTLCTPAPSSVPPSPWALKEWAVAVDALARGETILLLRKGGIREPNGKFAIPASRFWLYPTFEHQKSHLLKPPYADQVTSVPSGWHPTEVMITAWAELTHGFQVTEVEVISALLPYHIWSPEFLSERLKWKPSLPLSVLLLRVYRLSQPHTLAYRSSYGGCKSWIQLEIESEIEPEIEPEIQPEVTKSGIGEPEVGTAIPVLTEAAYLQQVATLTNLLSSDPVRLA